MPEAILPQMYTEQLAKAAPNSKIDVAVNIFAKPYATSLAILSLLRQSGRHVEKLWLQYEPMGIMYDKISAYCIGDYVRERNLAPLEIVQPDHWLYLNAITVGDLQDPRKRAAVRYQYAFENSQADLLFLMHNDVYFIRDLLAPMREALGDAFAIGMLGQCWNCPFAREKLTREVLGRGPCTPDTYEQFKFSHEELVKIYAEAQAQGIFVRPYALDRAGFSTQPWPAPECRINEWACLLNLAKTRNLCAPRGDAFPPGAYMACGEYNLDIGVAWFRNMHESGMRARHFDPHPYMRHWVGTGHNTPIKYARQEDNAFRIIRKHFPDYVAWLKDKYGSSALPC